MLHKEQPNARCTKPSKANLCALSLRYNPTSHMREIVADQGCYVTDQGRYMAGQCRYIADQWLTRVVVANHGHNAIRLL